MHSEWTCGERISSTYGDDRAARSSATMKDHSEPTGWRAGEAAPAGGPGADGVHRTLQRSVGIQRRGNKVREVQQGAPNQFDSTIRCRPERWTTGVWRRVYGLAAGGSGLASRKDNYVRGKFLHPVDPKDSFLAKFLRCPESPILALNGTIFWTMNLNTSTKLFLGKI